MENKSNTKYLGTFFTKLILFSSLFILVSCAVPNFMKPSKIDKDDPVSSKERARKNVTEGKAVSLKGMTKGGRGTSFEFSSSNPLWRASLETIDFMPLVTVDYSGGIIITDWYTDSSNTDESIKITVKFLSNEIRSDAIKIIVYKKNCKAFENCQANSLNGNIKDELKIAILRKASQLEKADLVKKK